MQASQQSFQQFAQTIHWNCHQLELHMTRETAMIEKHTCNHTGSTRYDDSNTSSSCRASTSLALQSYEGIHVYIQQTCTRVLPLHTFRIAINLEQAELVLGFIRPLLVRDYWGSAPQAVVPVAVLAFNRASYAHGKHHPLPSKY